MTNKDLQLLEEIVNTDMVHDIFGIDLLWYAKGSLPLYTCVVAGLLSNQMMLDDRIIAKIKEFR